MSDYEKLKMRHVKLDLNSIPAYDVVLDLNSIPAYDDEPEEAQDMVVDEPGEAQDMVVDEPEEAQDMVVDETEEAQDMVAGEPDEAQDHQRGLDGVLDLNSSPTHDGVLDLNSSPAHDEPDVPQDVVAGQPDGAQDMVVDQPGEQSLHVKHPKKDLTNEENYAAYFALEVIKSRDGDFQTEDKELVASLLNTSVRTIERIWRKAQDQLEQGHPVDVSNKKKGNSGQKKERFGTLEDENNITKQKKDNSISSKSSRC
jgi:hypothetical protein